MCTRVLYNSFAELSAAAHGCLVRVEVCDGDNNYSDTRDRVPAADGRLGNSPPAL